MPPGGGQLLRGVVQPDPAGPPAKGEDAEGDRLHATLGEPVHPGVVQSVEALLLVAVAQPGGHVVLRSGQLTLHDPPVSVWAEPRARPRVTVLTLDVDPVSE